MRVFLISSLAAVLCAAAPTPVSTPVDAVANSDAAPSLEFFHITLAQTPKKVDATVATPDSVIVEREAAARSHMDRGKRYTISNWVFSIGYYAVEQLGGTKAHFPTDELSIGVLAQEMASSVTNTIGDGTVAKNIGNGWTWKGQILGDGYEFNHMPYNVVYTTVVEAIRGAVDWITWDNAFEFIMNDTNGKAIASFMLYPTDNNGQIARFNDELR